MSGKHLPSGEPSQPQQTIHAPGDPDDLRAEVAHLHQAMESQRDIGKAIGLLSARYGCSTEEAWRTMLRVSQDSNTKVRDMAHALVITHDGTGGDADRELLRSFVAQFPASGWPQESVRGNDPGP